jgi:hypothetical protein
VAGLKVIVRWPLRCAAGATPGANELWVVYNAEEMTGGWAEVDAIDVALQCRKMLHVHKYGEISVQSGRRG